MSELRFVIDGESEDGTLQGDGDSSPFFVFDIQNQNYVSGPFETKRQAEDILAVWVEEFSQINQA